MFVAAEPQVLIIKDPKRDVESLLFHNHLLVKRVIDLCTKIWHNLGEFEAAAQLSGDIVKLLPEAALIDYVLKTEQLLTLGEFAAIFNSIPPFDYYDERVWPIPADYTPDNVYDWGKYDINLIFGRQT